MKKIVTYTIGICFLLNILACSSSKKSADVWVNKEKIESKSFHKIFITVLTLDVQARVQIEKDLAAAAEMKGYKVVKSIDVMPPSFKDLKIESKETIIEKVTENNCDAVFTIALIKQEDAIDYTPGGTHYAANTYNTMGGNFFGYYDSYVYYQTTTTTGSYNKDKNYFMESNLYDTESKTLMLSVHSNIFNPSSLAHFSQIFTKDLVKKIEKLGLVKK